MRTLALLSLLLVHDLRGAGAGPEVWVATSLERVGRSDSPRAVKEARMYAARGEYESYQIVVHAPVGGLKNANVEVSALAGPATIPAGNCTLYREHYVRAEPSSPDWHGKNRPGPAGWYPDALIPFTNPVTGASLFRSGAPIQAAPFDLPANKNQPIWVDVFVPRDAKPGQYKGSFTVTTEEGSASGQVLLTVWNFTLPVKPYLKSSFAYWTADSLAAEKELLRHRLSPQRVSSAHERVLMESYGLNTTDLHFWSGADNSHCSMSDPPSVSQLKAAARAHAPGLLLYNFTADEISKCRQLYPAIRKWGYNLHQAGVQNLVTMPPVPELFSDGSDSGRSAVDIWVILAVQYAQYASNIAKALKKGDSVWSYNTLVQDADSPKWLIDFTPMDFRIQPGFLNQALGFSGLLYWRVDMWSADPWREINNRGKLSSNNYPGEGVLVYPGKAAGFSGVAPSMRLKWLRDGVDDFDYIELLKHAGQGVWAFGVVRGVASGFSDWTRDPKVLAAARRQLGEKLDQLHRAAAVSPAAPH